MKTKTKQIITGVSANILFLPPIYFTFFHRGLNPDWLIVSLSFLPLIVVLIFFRIIWGSDCFKKAAWQEEGYSSFSEWFKESQTINGKIIRFSIKIFLPGFLLLTIITGIVIAALK